MTPVLNVSFVILFQNFKIPNITTPIILRSHYIKYDKVMLEMSPCFVSKQNTSIIEVD